MTERKSPVKERHSRHWFQLSLKSLFRLTLLVATFFAGYTLRGKQDEAERRRGELEAQRALVESRREAEAAFQHVQRSATVAGIVKIRIGDD